MDTKINKRNPYNLTKNLRISNETNKNINSLMKMIKYRCKKIHPVHATAKKNLNIISFGTARFLMARINLIKTKYQKFHDNFESQNPNGL